jgi:hypothetical protein
MPSIFGTFSTQQTTIANRSNKINPLVPDATTNPNPVAENTTHRQNDFFLSSSFLTDASQHTFVQALLICHIILNFSLLHVIKPGFIFILIHYGAYYVTEQIV